MSLELFQELERKVNPMHIDFYVACLKDSGPKGHGQRWQLCEVIDREAQLMLDSRRKMGMPLLYEELIDDENHKQTQNQQAGKASKFINQQISD